VFINSTLAVTFFALFASIFRAKETRNQQKQEAHNYARKGAQTLGKKVNSCVLTSFESPNEFF